MPAAGPASVAARELAAAAAVRAARAGDELAEDRLDGDGPHGLDEQRDGLEDEGGEQLSLRHVEVSNPAKQHQALERKDPPQQAPLAAPAASGRLRCLQRGAAAGRGRGMARGRARESDGCGRASRASFRRLSSSLSCFFFCASSSFFRFSCAFLSLALIRGFFEFCGVEGKLPALFC